MEYDELSESLAQSESEVLTTLTSHGGFAFKPQYSEFVVHTHSVPLASAVDNHYLKTEGVVSLFHGFEAGNKGIECPKRSCMYINKDGRRSHETIPKNCPCQNVVGPDGGPLKPRCFIAYVRSLGKLLASEHEVEENLDPAKIMFCQTHVSLFDNKYPGWFRDNLGVSGWGHVTDDYLTAALRALYWYRVYTKPLGLDKMVIDAIERQGLRLVKHAVSQAIHTINGVLIKRFMAFCPESVRYQDYAKQTAYMFRDLLRDYLHPLTYEGGKMVEPKDSTYMELKEFLNTVKSTFHGASFERRKKWLEFDFKSKSLRRMFSEIKRLRSLVEVKFQQGTDYTESPAWIFRCTTLCQTRVLGYLPNAVAEVRRKTFRDNVSRPLVRTPREQLILIEKSVEEELSRAEVPRGFMERPYWAGQKAEERFNNAMAAIELPLKGAASVDNFVKDGGKIEDARVLLDLAIKERWQIPVRDLHDHEVIETLMVDRDGLKSTTDYVRPLFWISYTVILNFFVKKGFIKGVEYYPLRKGSGTFDPDPMEASIVHISEPGKERNLTKSTGFLTWFLTPASKITQDTLAEMPEHMAGLKASGHEWRHQKRVSALSDEAGFIYDPVTGYTIDSVYHSFKDWTESTDFIGKLIGWAHLSSFLKYISFPRGYTEMIAMAILEPQPVVEVVSLKNFEEEIEYTPVRWEGFISEGYMMGNPMTKTILHLVHVSERCIVRTILERASVSESKRGPFLGLGDPVRMDRKKTVGLSGSDKLTT
jgi:hypothetical protein